MKAVESSGGAQLPVEPTPKVSQLWLPRGRSFLRAMRLRIDTDDRAVECTCNDFPFRQPAVGRRDPRGASLEDAEGRLEEIDGKLLLAHVIVKYRIKITKDQREATERALEHHAARCPVSESVKRSITVEWLGEIVEE